MNILNRLQTTLSPNLSPEKILAINCGSSSLKYSFFDTQNESLNAHGQIERIGIPDTQLSYHSSKGEIKRAVKASEIKAAFSIMLETLINQDTGVIKNKSDLTLIVHRVVHGGEDFTASVLITDQVLQKLEALSPLAPLHNPLNITGIHEMRRLLPNLSHVAVFDTTFHHTLPDYAYLYGLPYEMYQEKRIRRYGFHGISHQYVSLRAAQYLELPSNELRLISCHLGNGSSLCAIDQGKSIDTSMGFTPAEGLIMGTRCGDLDSGVISFLERNSGLTANQTEEILNKKSGLLGLSGISSDMRDIIKAADQGNQRAALAIKAYCYRIKKYLGSYVAAMGGVDCIIFTAGIGQASPEVRELALQGLECFGIVLDQKLNRQAPGFEEVCRISSNDSKVAVLIVPTEEERMMACEALRILSLKNKEN